MSGVCEGMDDYERFVDQQLGRLLRYAVMLTGERDLAADLVQDVLVRVFQQWPRSAAERPDTVDWTQRTAYQAKPSGAPQVGVYGTYAASVGGYDITAAQYPRSVGYYDHSSGAHQVQINGRPGVEFTKGGSQAQSTVFSRDSVGGTMQVDVMGPALKLGAAVARLAALSRRIASGITFPGTTTVQPTFGLGYLPSGLKIYGFMVQGGRAACLSATPSPADETSYQLSTGAHVTPTVAVGTNLDAGKGVLQQRPVHGHPTRDGVYQGARVLHVEDAVHGETVTIYSTVESTATLYKIADGLVLPKD